MSTPSAAPTPPTLATAAAPAADATNGAPAQGAAPAQGPPNNGRGIVAGDLILRGTHAAQARGLLDRDPTIDDGFKVKGTSFEGRKANILAEVREDGLEAVVARARATPTPTTRTRSASSERQDGGLRPARARAVGASLPRKIYVAAAGESSTAASLPASSRRRRGRRRRAAATPIARMTDQRARSAVCVCVENKGYSSMRKPAPTVR